MPSVCPALSLLPIGLYNNAAALVETQYWGKALAIAILATAIPYALDLQALKHLSKLSYGTLSSLSPALAALTGLLLLGEKNRMATVDCLAVCHAGIGWRDI